ncbi:hypothetical protein BDQ17DRAFT_1261401, partial [Cyathus striatus]
LFSLQNKHPHSNSNIIREVWALDTPTYGDSALLNAPSHTERVGNMTASELGIVTRLLIKSHHFKGHRIVLIGHSLGATA